LTLIIMSEENIIRKATFEPQVCTYWLLSGIIVFTVTIIGIPLLILWIPLGLIFTRRYLDRMECVLTPKALKVKKGILVRVEKTIPLEKITDMGMIQGPIMRKFGLHTLTVETAGQSGPGSLVALTGIVGAKEFRETVLAQRDMASGSSSESSSQATAGPGSETNDLLIEIRDSLLRLEKALPQNEKGEKSIQ